MHKKYRKKSAPPKTEAKLSDKLRGIVHLHPNVERMADPQYGYVLSWIGEPPPAQKWWRRIFNGSSPRRRRLVLDEMGRRTVELIDGRRSVREIADTLADDFSMDRGRAREAVILFLSQLMRKNVAQVLAQAGRQDIVESA